MESDKSMTDPRTSRALNYSDKTELIRIGQHMATWMYNVSQYSTVPELLREEMKSMVKQWDGIRRNGRLNPVLRNRRKS